MRSILITGCNRGLGLGLVKHLLKRADRPELLIATCRDMTKAQVIKNSLFDNNRTTENFDSLKFILTNRSHFCNVVCSTLHNQQEKKQKILGLDTNKHEAHTRPIGTAFGLTLARLTRKREYLTTSRGPNVNVNVTEA